jgi:hypothetical protein
MKWIYSDGGRASAGYTGTASDCVCRAIAIAGSYPYQEVYDMLNLYGDAERKSQRRKGKSSARGGVYIPTTRQVLTDLGWTWVPTMGIGTGCTVHLRDGELPMGRLIVSVSRHIVAVIDGVIYDTHNCSREGNRCVYGYWVRK